MKIIKKYISGKLYNIALPLIEPSDCPTKGETLASENMNRFYTAMTDEIIRYINESERPKIRKYYADCVIPEPLSDCISYDERITITVSLHARVTCANGYVSSRRRSLTQTWQSGTIVSFLKKDIS